MDFCYPNQPLFGTCSRTPLSPPSLVPMSSDATTPMKASAVVDGNQGVLVLGCGLIAPPLIHFFAEHEVPVTIASRTLSRSEEVVRCSSSDFPLPDLSRCFLFSMTPLAPYDPWFSDGIVGFVCFFFFFLFFYTRRKDSKGSPAWSSISRSLALRSSSGS